MTQRVNVVTCRLRRDGKYLLVIKDVCGGRQERTITHDRSVPEGSDIMVRGDKVVQS